MRTYDMKYNNWVVGKEGGRGGGDLISFGSTVPVLPPKMTDSTFIFHHTQAARNRVGQIAGVMHGRTDFKHQHASICEGHQAVCFCLPVSYVADDVLSQCKHHVVSTLPGDLNMLSNFIGGAAGQNATAFHHDDRQQFPLPDHAPLVERGLAVDVGFVASTLDNLIAARNPHPLQQGAFDPNAFPLRPKPIRVGNIQLLVLFLPPKKLPVQHDRLPTEFCGDACCH